jgi:signal transduction histidine kinase/ActR/RegA family two-component response regulator
MIVGLANHTILLRKDGTEVPVDDSGAPVRDAGGETTGVVLVFRDITGRKRAEDALQKAHAELEQRVLERTAELSRAYGALQREIDERRQTEEQLRQSQKMEAMGTLAGGIAHDFNNLLAAILGFTEMAAEDVQDRPEVGKSLRHVLTSAMRARDLVKKILAFSRKTSYERGPLSLVPLIEETVQLLRASIPATIVIKLSMTASSDTILASASEVQQILMNLATNASYAMQDKGGILEISLTDIDAETDSPAPAAEGMSGNCLQLIVKDSGIGMGPEVMKRVFEPFFTTREVGKGTGMGLSVVYGIVKDLQGVITVESEQGLGSTFRVSLPKAKTRPVEEQPHAVQLPRGRERILFVDDEDMLVEWGRAVLEKLGYTVEGATDSNEALKTFSSDPDQFDLVITDHTMPSMTGVQLSRELVRTRSDLPIILCTGHSETVSPEIAKEAGIREYLMKPVAKGDLAAAVRRALDAHKDE